MHAPMHSSEMTVRATASGAAPGRQFAGTREAATPRMITKSARIAHGCDGPGQRGHHHQTRDARAGVEQCSAAALDEDLDRVHRAISEMLEMVRDV